jgi:hypothetical protein
MTEPLPGYDAWKTREPDPEPFYSAPFKMTLTLEVEAFMATDKDGVVHPQDLQEFLDLGREAMGEATFNYAADFLSFKIDKIERTGDVEVDE